MGKKRKAIEISEEDKIQAIIVRDPYGWKDPSSWDGHEYARLSLLYAILMEYAVDNAKTTASIRLSNGWNISSVEWVHLVAWPSREDTVLLC